MHEDFEVAMLAAKLEAYQGVARRYNTTGIRVQAGYLDWLARQKTA